MPVEIKELVIRATVNSDAQQGESSVSHDSFNKNDIIRSCVEEVLKILERDKER